LPVGGKDGRIAFPTTHWTQIITAGQPDSPGADLALADLCTQYWYPLYAYVRGRGHSPADAQDLTQEFFSQLIEKGFLRIADPNRGRFRVFLRASLQHFLCKEWTRAHRQKRGGGCHFVSLDDAHAEDRYRNEPADGLSPDRLFDRKWAVSLLEQTFTRLRQECEASGKGRLFERAQPLLSGARAGLSYAELGASLGMSEGAFKVAVHRLRQRFGQILRESVAQTVSSPEAVDEEIDFLFDAFAV
jgi:RNA polymerase sigma-70 factor (ECF subfamily)